MSIVEEVPPRRGLGAEDGSTYSTAGRESELPAELSDTPCVDWTDDERGASSCDGEDESTVTATGLIVSSASSCEAGGIGRTEEPGDCGPSGRSSVTAPRSELADGFVGVTIAESARVVS
jgi:hypothetical protein